MKVIENKEFRQQVFAHLIEDRTEKVGPPHFHSLWPCVRLGVAQRLLVRAGRRFYTPRKALIFLRGMAIEAGLVTPSTRSGSAPPAIMHRGVLTRPDWWYIDGDPYLFIEVKSTIASSQRMWVLVKQGEVDILGSIRGDVEISFRNYFEQVACYCVALGVNEAGLVVYFLQGDYADRRKHCPECKTKSTLGWSKEQGGDLYQICSKCGYKSYAIDLRAYSLQPTKEELAYFDEEVFVRRKGLFVKAVEAGEPMAAPPSQGYLCRDCRAGREVGCEFA